MKDYAFAVPGIGIIGIQPDGLIKSLYGLVKPALLP
jgi:hypothetical protein